MLGKLRLPVAGCCGRPGEAVHAAGYTARMQMAVLRVAVPLPFPGALDYLPRSPGDLAGAVGCRVSVRVGTRSVVGIVVDVGPPDVDVDRLRPIEARLDAGALVDAELLVSLRRASAYYHAPLGELLATALPTALRNGGPLPETRDMAWASRESVAEGVGTPRPGTRTRALLELLRAAPRDEATLDVLLPRWRPAMRALASRGLVARVDRSPQATPVPVRAIELTAEQSVAAAAVRAALGGFAPFLLDGVTGSGKTEVYLEAIAACLAGGRQALVLVPEIGLTPQMLRRFTERLGVPVLALHSGLADGERAKVWMSMARAEGRVLVGTRSAVFTPLPAAGLIVVDEEHDASYKQQDGVRYSARDLALLRGQALGVPVVLGSATPAMESLAAARAGRYRSLHLGSRAGGARAPRVEIVDVRRRALRAGLSDVLLDALRNCLEAGGQALVFRNRRGYAPVLLCHDCGWSARCTRCDAPMTVHARGRRLQCHHCGAAARVPDACPECGTLGLQPQGAGTERIEDALAECFPDVPIVRVDRGTTQRRGGLGALLAKLGDDPGILVGTQMLAKGHDLPGLELVGVVGVDEGLHSADFRASERLAQLLVQVSGRAGRGRRPGRVLLQTHHPRHPLLLTLLAGGYAAFAELELAERKDAGFPPYAHLALLRAEAVETARVRTFLDEARTLIEAVEGRTGVEVLGPVPAPMERRAGRVRWQLLLSAARRGDLHALLSDWLPRLRALASARRVRWSIDVDPLDLY